ncbi:MAG: GntR family transcriptional regulator [Rhodospirillaceae bacterium]|jgi:DNA-binding GntR family transcriptional regulator|nr:GntR family transcriptional regulator [Rhodospirillaceae bacterium]|tara:strand:- start:1464 stop:2141 length:678 start_codon:yes stop_codon:yes gene_type:complete
MTTDTLKQAAPENQGTSLGEFVLGRLRDAIRDRRYQPGQRIREAEVAQWLGVSRTPVREAFRRLQADGLLVLTPWRGAQVAELGRQQVVELYAMRQALEGTAAGLAAEHASAAEVDLLFDLIEQDQAAQGEPNRLAEINRRFHEAVYGAAHNRYLLEALNALDDSLALLKSTTYEVPGRAEAARQEHIGIAEAIRRRDSETAEQAARAHISTAEKARLKLLFGDD